MQLINAPRLRGIVRRITCMVLGALWASSAMAGADVSAAPAPSSGDSLDEVLVTGERPGPGMWRVWKGDHELWIFATLSPLPKKMTWRSDAVDSRIIASQTLLAPPSITTDIGFFRGVTLLPSLMRARKSPDGRTLETVLPHDLYIRWLALRVRYLGNGGSDEQMRPILAALDVYTHALDDAGLVSDDGVWEVVERTAHTHHVPVMPVTLKLSIDDPKASIRDLGRIPQDAEVACFEKTIERVETGMPGMRRRADLWALGDVAGLRAQTGGAARMVCLDAFFSVPELRDQLQAAKQRLDAAWLTAVDDVVGKNASTFAVLPMLELIEPGGWLDRLRARGYAVQEP